MKSESPRRDTIMMASALAAMALVVMDMVVMDMARVRKRI